MKSAEGSVRCVYRVHREVFAMWGGARRVDGRVRRRVGCRPVGWEKVAVNFGGGEVSECGCGG
jgi:hypothetical protein